MGVLTDYFVAADDADASQCREQGPQLAGLPTVQAKALDPVVTMATLEGILTKADPMAIIEASDGAGVGESDEQGPWIFRLRESLVQTLDPPDGPRLSSAAGQWAATEELVGSNPQDLYAFLWNLAHLASWARANGMKVYCWVSL